MLDFQIAGIYVFTISWRLSVYATFLYVGLLVMDIPLVNVCSTLVFTSVESKTFQQAPEFA